MAIVFHYQTPPLVTSYLKVLKSKLFNFSTLCRPFHNVLRDYKNLL